MTCDRTHSTMFFFFFFFFFCSWFVVTNRYRRNRSSSRDRSSELCQGYHTGDQRARSSRIYREIRRQPRRLQRHQCTHQSVSISASPERTLMTSCAYTPSQLYLNACVHALGTFKCSRIQKRNQENDLPDGFPHFQMFAHAFNSNQNHVWFTSLGLRNTTSAGATLVQNKLLHTLNTLR